MMRTRKSPVATQLLTLAAAAALAAAAGCPKSDDANRRPSPVQGEGYSAAASFDPVAANGPIFVDWPRPQLALVVTGELLGYLEPCGCAGLHNQKGGLARRHALLNELRDQKGWPVVAVDTGGLVRRFGTQAEIKFQTAASALEAMRYAAVGLGAGELHLPVEAILAIAGDQRSAAPLVSANVAPLGFDAGYTQRYQLAEQGGRKIGITAILGGRFASEISSTDFEIRDAVEALSEVVPELAAHMPDLLVLLAHAPPEESAALARQFPQFDVVVTAGGAEEPPAQPRTIDGTQAWLVEVGHKGMYAAVIGIYDDPEQPRRYQRVPLDSRFASTPEMLALLEAYQEQLQATGFEALGAKPTVHPRAASADDALGLFVGAERCGKCHSKAYATWRSTKHAHATETLAKLNPPRQFDPECISCHVTGWNPQEYFPYHGGFQGLATTPHLAGNGCENCHGPGGAHALAEEERGARNLARRNELRQMMRLTKATAEVTACKQCHDLDNSPEFDFLRYWPKVEHRGKD